MHGICRRGTHPIAPLRHIYTSLVPDLGPHNYVCSVKIINSELRCILRGTELTLAMGDGLEEEEVINFS